MIGYISGTVVYSDTSKSIVLTAQGVGYEIHTSTPKVPNRDVALFISHIIREQSQDLYGFDSSEEKKFFEMLIDVNGIGPKSAFSLISHLGVEQIFSAITFENVDLIKSAPGIGKKSAEQIVLSLKDKISKLQFGLAVKENPVKSGAAVSTEKSFDAHILKETLAACQGLGYKDQDVLPMIQRHLQEGVAKKPEDLVKIILKELR